MLQPAQRRLRQWAEGAMRADLAQLRRSIKRLLPEDRVLPEGVWERRHTALVTLLWLHAIALAVYEALTGPTLEHALIDGGTLVAAAVLAGRSCFSRHIRAGAASFGLVSASALLVHLSGGYIEIHFYFFVVITLIALYQDWTPFLVAVSYVVLHHGVLGVLDPTSVYNHPAALEHPFIWMLIHGGFVLAASAASLLMWRLNEHQTLYDPLTNLANRALFMDRVEHALTHGGHQARSIAMLFLDLDHFKGVNDGGGHSAGDLILRAVADRLRGCVRAVDTVARLGGDEFGILLEDVRDVRDAARMAQRILDEITAPFALRDGQVTISGSIGLCLSGADRQAAETLVHYADVAMYAAKDAGRGRYAIFEAGMHAAVMRRLELEADLRLAVEREEFQLLYQPIVDLERGHIAGVEALVRWAHPRQGLVPPSEFIAVAEEAGQIVPMGRWALHEACRQAQAWHDAHPAHPPLSVSVNLSPRQLQDARIVEDVAAALAASGLDSRLLLIEVTEGVLMEDTEANIATLCRLKDLGVRLAIDDFGTGYSSLSYLRRFPIDVVKIDKSFIHGITEGPEASALARAIITLGRTLHLSTVAEGIECAAQFATLRDLGCDLGQGYYFAQPLPPSAVGGLLACPATWAAPKATDVASRSAAASPSTPEGERRAAAPDDAPVMASCEGGAAVEPAA
ncbi:MAG: EAL domain-containing protein [Chloroflexi bacterium]|nr:EAL domain-containing protein [Chloroflexota bacterium]